MARRKKKYPLSFWRMLPRDSATQNLGPARVAYCPESFYHKTKRAPQRLDVAEPEERPPYGGRTQGSKGTMPKFPRVRGCYLPAPDGAAGPETATRS